jgi:hypothetical protein
MASRLSVLILSERNVATYHGEVIESVTPRKLHDNIERNQIVTGIQHTDVAFTAADVDKLRNMLARVSHMRLDQYIRIAEDLQQRRALWILLQSQWHP